MLTFKDGKTVVYKKVDEYFRSIEAILNNTLFATKLPKIHTFIKKSHAQKCEVLNDHFLELSALVKNHNKALKAGKKGAAQLKKIETGIKKLVSRMKAEQQFNSITANYKKIMGDAKHVEASKVVMKLYKKAYPDRHKKMTSIMDRMNDSVFLYEADGDKVIEKVAEFKKDVDAVMRDFMKDMNFAIANDNWIDVEHVEAREKLEKFLANDHPKLWTNITKLWKEKWFARHRRPILNFVENLKHNLNDPGQILDFKAYLTNLVKFGKHYNKLLLLHSQYVSCSDEKRDAIARVINDEYESWRSEDVKFSRSLSGALKILRSISADKYQPKPFNVKGAKGIEASDIDAFIASDEKNLSVLQDTRFHVLLKAEYEDSKEYKGALAEAKRVAHVKGAERLIAALKHKDVKVRRRALAVLRKLAGRIRTFKDFYTSFQSIDLDAMKVFIPKGNVDLDQDQIISDIGAYQTRGFGAKSEWWVRDGNSLSDDVTTVHRVLSGVHSYLANAKDVDRKVIKIAEFLIRGKARRAMTKVIDEQITQIDYLTGIIPHELTELYVKMQTETDMNKLFKMYRDAQFLTQSKLILAQIDALREAHEDVSAQYEANARIAHKTGKIVRKAGPLYFWAKYLGIGKKRLEMSGVTLDSLDRAKKAILKAQKMFRSGINRGNARQFMRQVRIAQNNVKYAGKALESNKGTVNHSTATFMHGAIGLGTIALSICTSSLASGYVAALFPAFFQGGSFAASATMMGINAASFTGTMLTADSYIHGTEITPWRVVWELGWNTAMFGIFGKFVNPALKSAMGIKSVHAGLKELPKGLWAKAAFRVGMEGAERTNKNLAKVAFRLVSKELGALTGEAIAFQGFEAYKLFVASSGIGPDKVHDLTGELKNLVMPKSIIHGMGNLLAIKAIGYGSGRVTQALTNTNAFKMRQIKMLATELQKTEIILNAHAEGKLELSPMVEGKLKMRARDLGKVFHEMGVEGMGEYVMLAELRVQESLGRLKAIRDQYGHGVKGISRALGLNAVEAKQFEIAVRKHGMNDLALANDMVNYQIARMMGEVSKAKLKLMEHMLNRKLKKIGFTMRDGKLVDAEIGRLAKAIEDFSKLPPKEKVKVIGGAAAIIAGIFVEPITTSFLALGMVAGSGGKKINAKAYKAKLGEYNNKLKEYDEASGKQRSGKDLTNAEKKLLEDTKLKKMPVRRLRGVQSGHISRHI
jgi:hypothetical protein